MNLKMLSDEDRLAEIRRLYFQTTRETIQQDFAKALDLLKSMATDDERERAAAFMDGLAEMRADWSRGMKAGQRKKKKKKRKQKN